MTILYVIFYILFVPFEILHKIVLYVQVTFRIFMGTTFTCFSFIYF